jgi:polysaccharide biosynthesis protein PslH
MKILMVTFLLPNPQALNGPALVMHGQLATLAAHHEVTLVTFAVAEPTEQKVLDHLRASGVTVYEVGGSLPAGILRWKRRWQQALRQLRGGRPLGMKFTDPRMQHLLDRLLGQQRFDLLQVENIGFGQYRYRTQIPSILTEHEVARSLSDNGDDWQQHQPTLWRQFDRLQVFTPHDAAEMRRVVPELADRVRINPFGIDIPAETDPSSEEPSTVVFVGGFNHPPNVDAALWLGNDIMPVLRRLWPGIRSIVVGSYPPKALQALAGDDFIVTGRVPAVEPYLERAAVVLAPLRIGGGMRIKVLQAMALGKAIVTTPLGAEGIATTDGQPPLAIVTTAEEVASTTASLLAASEARLELGRRARAFVAEHHSWSSYRQRLETIYAELHPKP